MTHYQRPDGTTRPIDEALLETACRSAQEHRPARCDAPRQRRLKENNLQALLKSIGQRG